MDTGALVGGYRVTGAYPVSGYRALDLADFTRVHLDISSSDDWRDRAIQHLRAASIVGSIEHPGVAHIHNRGVLPDRRPWIASELAEGVPLCEILSRRTLEPDEATALVRDLAEIAAHAHDRRIVHGSIRPHLVTLRTGEKPFSIQLGGWGDMRSPGATDPPLAITWYMAPELVRGAHVDGKIDVYAIGAMIYFGLTGRFPHAMLSADVKVSTDPLDALLRRMLAFDADERMTALEVLAAATRLCHPQRLSRPRWTPAPLPDGERVANIIDFAAARQKRS